MDASMDTSSAAFTAAAAVALENMNISHVIVSKETILAGLLSLVQSEARHPISDWGSS